MCLFLCKEYILTCWMQGIYLFADDVVLFALSTLAHSEAVWSWIRSSFTTSWLLLLLLFLSSHFFLLFDLLIFILLSLLIFSFLLFLHFIWFCSFSFSISPTLISSSLPWPSPSLFSLCISLRLLSPCSLNHAFVFLISLPRSLLRSHLIFSPLSSLFHTSPPLSTSLSLHPPPPPHLPSLPSAY